MPSLITHSFFAEDFLFSHLNEHNFITAHPDVFKVASEGPDPFFFVGLVPKRGINPKIIKMRPGSALHHAHCSEIMSLMLDHIENDMTLDEDKDVFRAFAFGQLSHYLLDSTAHPFIYYWSGFDASGHLSRKYSYQHSHFEGCIDTALATNRGRKDLLSAPSKVLRMNDDDLDTVDQHFDEILEKFFQVKLPQHMYYNSVKNMIDIYDYVNKSGALKLSMLSLVHLKQLYIPRSIEPICLNDAHDKWLEPKSGAERRESFSELYQKALRSLEGAYDAVMSQGFTMQALKPFFKGLNYNGLLPEEKNTYFDKEGTHLK
jgi:hypothetical protein